MRSGVAQPGLSIDHILDRLQQLDAIQRLAQVRVHAGIHTQPQVFRSGHGRHADDRHRREFFEPLVA